MTKRKRNVLVAVAGDTHAGSTVALCPPEGVLFDDSGTYMPSKPQVWMFEGWERYWAEVKQIRKEHNAKLVVALNGDLTEGRHHGLGQLISPEPEVQGRVARRVLGVPKALRPSAVYVIRGTETHTGPAGSEEEALAEWLGCAKDPDTRKRSTWHRRLEVHGVRFDFQHHPGTHGKLPWTQPQAVQRLAFLIWTEHQLAGVPHPHLAFRAHRHLAGDSFGAYPTRAIITPSWKLKDAFAHKVASESYASYGGSMVLVAPDGEYEVRHHHFAPDPPRLIQETP